MDLNNYPIFGISTRHPYITDLISKYDDLDFLNNGRNQNKFDIDKKRGLAAEALAALVLNLSSPKYTNLKYGDGGVDHYDKIFHIPIDIKTFRTTNKSITFPKALQTARINKQIYPTVFVIFGNIFVKQKHFFAHFLGFLIAEDIPIELLKNSYHNNTTCYMYLKDLLKLTFYSTIYEVNNRLTKNV